MFSWVEWKFVIFAVFVKNSPFLAGTKAQSTKKINRPRPLVAHDCGYPLSRYHVSQLISWIFIAFCRCSTGVALHPLKNLDVRTFPPPPIPGRCRTEIWLSEKVSRYTGVSQLQLRVVALHCATKRRPLLGGGGEGS